MIALILFRRNSPIHSILNIIARPVEKVKNGYVYIIRGGDLLILPSSVHETIILRREARLEYNEIAALVKEINQ